MTAQLRLLGSFGLTDADGPTSRSPRPGPSPCSPTSRSRARARSPAARSRSSCGPTPPRPRRGTASASCSTRSGRPGRVPSGTSSPTRARSPSTRRRGCASTSTSTRRRSPRPSRPTAVRRPPSRAAFERAADLYRGDLLPDAYDDWIAVRRERLVATHQRTLDRLIGLLERQGDYRAAIEYGQRRLRLDPLDERVYRWLMRLHALNQDRAGALRVYQACVATLAEELGVEPDAETRRLHDQIVRREPSPDGDVAAPTGVRALRRRRRAGTAAARRPPGRVGRRDRGLGARGRRRGGPPGHRRRGGHRQVAAGGRARGVDVGPRGAPSATRAYAAEGRLSYAPVAEWLRSPALAASLPRLDAGSLGEISRLLPELLTQRPDLPRPSARIEDWQRQAFFGALVSAFVVDDRPQLLVLDDLQWCDADTLEWLHFLLRADRRAAAGRGHRPIGRGRRRPSRRRLVAGLREEGRLTEIALGPLEPAETSALAAQVAGRALTPAQADDLQRETEGNPLFVVETVRAGLVQPVRVRPIDAADDGVAGAAPPRAIAPKVQQVIAARLAQLSAPARDLASVAATVGRAFTLDVVDGASGLAEDAVVDGLDELLRRAVVREQGGGAYDFAHDKIREVAYAKMTDASRRLLHRRVAESLERVHAAALDAVAAQIAAQYANAGPGRPGRHVLPARRRGRAADRGEPRGDRAPQPWPGAARDPAAQRGARRPRARAPHRARRLARRDPRLRLGRGGGGLRALPPAVPGAGTTAQPADPARARHGLARPGPDRRLPRPRRPPAERRGARRRPGASRRGPLRDRGLAAAERRDAAGAGRARGVARRVRPLAIADPHRPLLAGPGRRVLDPPRPAPVDHGRAGRVRPAARRELRARRGARPPVHAGLRADLGRHPRVPSRQRGRRPWRRRRRRWRSGGTTGCRSGCRSRP